LETFFDKFLILMKGYTMNNFKNILLSLATESLTFAAHAGGEGITHHGLKAVVLTPKDLAHSSPGLKDLGYSGQAIK
jgi:hypothetical protein